MVWERSWGGIVEEPSDALLAACQIAGLVAAALLFPGAVIDLVFGTDLLNILSQAALAAFAVALILAVWRFPKQM